MDQRPGGSILFLIFCDQTAFFKLDSIFPECHLHREEMPRTDPFMCLYTACPGNKNCMEALAKRVFVIFKEVLPQVELLVLYFRRQTDDSLGAGLFWKDMREPRYITMNPSAWDLIKSRGLVFQFTPGPHFFLTGSAPPPEEQPDEKKSGLETP